MLPAVLRQVYRHELIPYARYPWRQPECATGSRRCAQGCGRTWAIARSHSSLILPS